MKKTILTTAILIAFFSVALIQSCESPASPKAVVTVIKVDDQGVKWPEPNAEVYIDPPEGTSQPDLLEYAQKPKLTDVNGQVKYDFKYEGILKVRAVKGSGGESCGQGVLILKEGETYFEEVRLSACFQ